MKALITLACALAALAVAPAASANDYYIQVQGHGLVTEGSNPPAVTCQTARSATNAALSALCRGSALPFFRVKLVAATLHPEDGWTFSGWKGICVLVPGDSGPQNCGLNWTYPVHCDGADSNDFLATTTTCWFTMPEPFTLAVGVRAVFRDLVAPQTTISAGPAAGSTTGSTSATFSFSSSQPNSTLQCRLDAGAWEPCVSPKSYTNLPGGNRTFAVRATDPSGNQDTTPATRSWTVDVIPPTTTITAGPSGPTPATIASFSFTAGEAGSTFQCKLDSAPFTPCITPWSLQGLAQGSHTFSVRAVDPVGNTDLTPATRSWSVDTIAPDTTLTTGPSGTTTTTAASFTFTSNEAGTSFECKLDAGIYSLCSSPASLQGLGQGQHTMLIRARDAAGNPDASPATRTWTVDTGAPDTTISAGPSGAVPTSSAEFAFTASEAGATFECKLDGAAFAACGSPRSYAGLAQGQHTFQVRAKDALGNTDASPATRTWIVDTTAPDTTATGPAGTLVNNAAAIIAASSEPGSTMECRLDSGAYGPCVSPKTYTNLPAGAHTVQVRARDAAGNTDSTPASVSWTVALGQHAPGAVTCPAGGLLTAAAPSAFGNDHSAPQLVAWRTDFYRHDGASWQLVSSTPVLVGTATHTSAVATWFDAQTGNAVGSTAQVTQTHQALPAGGLWLTAHLFYYLTLDGLAQGYDYVVGSTSSGPNASAGGVCSW